MVEFVVKLFQLCKRFSSTNVIKHGTAIQQVIVQYFPESI